jgi:hypothetical protein
MTTVGSNFTRLWTEFVMRLNKKGFSKRQKFVGWVGEYVCVVFCFCEAKNQWGNWLRIFLLFKHLSSKFLKDSNEKKIPCILILSLNAYNAHSLV